MKAFIFGKTITNLSLEKIKGSDYTIQTNIEKIASKGKIVF